jgi:hypothetical protein
MIIKINLYQNVNLQFPLLLRLSRNKIRQINANCVLAAVVVIILKHKYVYNVSQKYANHAKIVYGLNLAYAKNVKLNFVTNAKKM